MEKLYLFETDILFPTFTGEAGAIMAKALARAQALEILGKAIGREHGSKVGIGNSEITAHRLLFPI